MKSAHVNHATFTGTVEKMSALERTESGRPLLRFFLDTGNSAKGSPSGVIGEVQRCIAYGETAEQLVQRVRSGAIVRVEGPLRVNSRARRGLYQRIAKIYVQNAVLLRPARTADEILAPVLGPEEESEHDLPPPPTNELHLVGRVVAVDREDVIPQLTLSTRLPFAATHDVLFWGDALDGAVPVGAIAEVRGLLFHHIENWDDGQVRLISRVHTEHLTVLDDTAGPTAVVRRFTSAGSSHPDALRLN